MKQALAISLALISMTWLTGCGLLTPKERLVVQSHTEYVLPPEVYLSCRARPIAPDRGAPKWAWSDYAADLWAWGDDCAGKVQGMADWVHSKAKEPKP